MTGTMQNKQKPSQIEAKTINLDKQPQDGQFLAQQENFIPQMNRQTEGDYKDAPDA